MEVNGAQCRTVAGRRWKGGLAVVATALALIMPAASVAGASPTAAHRSAVTIAHAVHRHAPAGLVLVVNSTANLDATNPASGPCVASNGKCTLVAAVQIGDTRQVPVTIKLPAATFLLVSPLVDFDVAGMTFLGAGQSKTFISAGDNFPVLAVSDGATIGASASLAGVGMWATGVTFEHGASESTGPWTGEGGCILVLSPNDYLSLTASAVSHCNASYGGGGIWSVGTVEATGTTFFLDVAGSYGGAIDIGYKSGLSEGGDGFLSATGSVFMDDFVSAGSNNAQGGAIAARGSVVVRSSSFLGDATTGSSSYGGAMYLTGATSLVGDKFTSNHAYPFSSSTDSTYGGAVYARTTARIVSSTFSHNTTGGLDAYGGAFYNAGTANFLGDHFSANTASGSGQAEGGAVYNNGASTLTSSSLAGNVATSPNTSYGGAIYDNDGIIIVASSFTANKGLNGQGGAIYDSGGGTDVSGSTFTGNLVSGGAPSDASGPGYAGAIAAESSLTSTGNHYIANHASQGGGALWNDFGIESTGDYFTKNSAFEGGAVWNYWQFSGVADAFVANTATIAGGAIFNVGFTGTLYAHDFTLMDSVVAGNVSLFGGGIYLQGGASASAGSWMRNSVVSANRTPSGTESECALDTTLSHPLPLLSLGGNTVGDNSCGTPTATDHHGIAGQGLWLAAPTGAVHGLKLPVAGHLSGAVRAIAAAPGALGYWEVTAPGVVPRLRPRRDARFGRWQAPRRHGDGDRLDARRPRVLGHLVDGRGRRTR